MVEITVVVGTRPEIIKMAPVIREIRDRSEYRLRLVHTGQHYDDGLSGVFFETLALPAPDLNLDVGSATQGRQTADGIVGMEAELMDDEPAAVLAQGDTNAVLSTAIACAKLPTTFGHVEAGIRSYDRSMPEEVNRVLADHAADLLFAPTDVARENLSEEGIEDGVTVTGNTVVDACRQHVDIAERESDVLERLDLSPGRYAVGTIHRPVNTDDPDRLRTILDGLEAAGVPVVLPAHPRTANAISDLGYLPGDGLAIVDPLDYLDFLELQRNAWVIVTDSGGIQEEASVLEVPCLTVRPNTERPETVSAGVNELVEPGDIERRLSTVARDDACHQSMRGSPALYGDGNAARRIVESLSPG